MKCQPLNWNGEKMLPCEPHEANHLRIKVPGPVSFLVLPIKPPHGWQWNGSVDSPSLQPSILTTNPREGLRCHSYLTDGKFQFLSDTSHELANQTVPAPEFTLDEL
jgi:hypothetical protein